MIMQIIMCLMIVVLAVTVLHSDKKIKSLDIQLNELYDLIGQACEELKRRKDIIK